MNYRQTVIITDKRFHLFELILLLECRAGYSAKGKYGALSNKLLRVPMQNR